MKTVVSAIPLLVSLTGGSTAYASPKADIELDPLAYALGGTSVHGGIQVDRFRFDLGAFSLDVPEAFHGNMGFALSMAGAGLKLDYFPLAQNTGLFFGAEVSLSKTTIIESGSKQADRATHAGVSARVGYRIDLGKAFFLSPWVSVGYASGEDRVIGGRTFEHSRLTVFPTVHIGYRFR